MLGSFGVNMLNEAQRLEIRRKFVAEFLQFLSDSNKAMGKPGLDAVLPIHSNRFRIFCETDINLKLLQEYYNEHWVSYRLCVSNCILKLRNNVNMLNMCIEKENVTFQQQFFQKMRRKEEIEVLLNMEQKQQEECVKLRYEFLDIEDELYGLMSDHNAKISQLTQQFNSECSILNMYEYIWGYELRISKITKDNSVGFSAYLLEVTEKEPNAA